MRPTYPVTVSREDNLWVAVVDGVPAGATDVERFGDLDVEVRDLVAGLTDSEPDRFTIDWRYLPGGIDVTVEIEDFMHARSDATAAVRRRDEALWSVIAALRGAGLSVRAIADVVELSHQRVHQLLSHGAA
jgi:hypothetical protein